MIAGMAGYNRSAMKQASANNIAKNYSDLIAAARAGNRGAQQMLRADGINWQTGSGTSSLGSSNVIVGGRGDGRGGGSYTGGSSSPQPPAQLQAYLDDVKRAQAEREAAAKARSEKIQSGYQQLEQDLLNTVSGRWEAQRSRAEKGYQDVLGEQSATLAQMGMLNTTQRAALALGARERTEQTLQDIAGQEAGELAGIKERTRRGLLDMQERITESGPDIGMMAQLAQMYGQGYGENTYGGGTNAASMAGAAGNMAASASGGMRYSYGTGRYMTDPLTGKRTQITTRTSGSLNPFSDAHKSAAKKAPSRSTSGTSRTYAEMLQDMQNKRMQDRASLKARTGISGQKSSTKPKEQSPWAEFY